MTTNGDDVSKSSILEQADVVAGFTGVRSGLVRRAGNAAERLDFSVVGSRAMFEGDIYLGAAEDLAPSTAPPDGAEQSVVIADTSKLWPQGRVPYEPLPATSPIQNIVIEAIRTIEANTVVRFPPRKVDDADFIAFELSAFCSSRVGRNRGRQTIQLSSEAAVGNAVHEICHTLGLWHEQSRSDRDEFLTVNWENVEPGYEHNFRQLQQQAIDVGPYDFGSIMHYPPEAFSRNGSPTLTSKVSGVTFGQRDALSAGDIHGLNSLYVQAPPPQSTSFGDVQTTGVQFNRTIRARQTSRVVTTDWPRRRPLKWEVIPVAGPSGLPSVSWQVTLGRSSTGSQDTVDYYFEIRNLTGSDIEVEARYSWLAPP